MSSGSACTSASLEPSYVLVGQDTVQLSSLVFVLSAALQRALGVEEDMAHTSLRFGIGRFTTEQEVDRAVKLCVKEITRLREMSPLWEMVSQRVASRFESSLWSTHVHVLLCRYKKASI